MDKREKSQLLLGIIKDISNNKQIDINIIIEELTKLYNGEFRHSYSDISYALKKGYESNKSFETLINNLDLLNNRLEEENSLLSKKFFKLYDHINLEIIRISGEQQNYDKLYTTYNEVIENINEVKLKVKAEENKINNIQIELSTYKIDIIGIISMLVSLFAIFGINASVISVLASMKTVSLIQMVSSVIIVNFFITSFVISIMIFTKKMFFQYYDKFN